MYDWSEHYRLEIWGKTKIWPDHLIAGMTLYIYLLLTSEYICAIQACLQSARSSDLLHYDAEDEGKV